MGRRMIVAITGRYSRYVCDGLILDSVLKYQKVHGINLTRNDDYLNKVIIDWANKQKIPLHLYLPYPHIKKAKSFRTDLTNMQSIIHTGSEYHVGCWQINNQKIVEDSDLILVTDSRSPIIKECRKQEKPVINLVEIYNAFASNKNRFNNKAKTGPVLFKNVSSSTDWL